MTFSNLEHDGVNRYSSISETDDKWFTSCYHFPQHDTETVDIAVWGVVGALGEGGRE